MKKIINKPETVVIEMCNGIALAHPEIEFLDKYKILKKKEINKDKVSLISGGGSGHEPAHAGFVGKGMLDGAVCGDVFASPSQIQVYQGIKTTQSDKGTLLIIKNYSGDIMNFKNGANLAMEDGIEVDYVKVDDDIAVKDSLYTVGKRGVAGTVLVHKIAGAAASLGWDLKKVKEAAELAVDNVKSIGFAFTSCTVPAKGGPTFTLGDNEMEYGVGIHGEPGIRREAIISADELSQKMVNDLLKELDLLEDQEIVLLVNGFGATPLQELYLLNNSLRGALAQKDIKVYRTFVGNYMTSIDMAGASVSIMKLSGPLKELLDQECDTPAFRVSGPVLPVPYVDRGKTSQEGKEIDYKMTTDSSYAKITGEKTSLSNITYIVDKMSECIIKNEIPFCELDSHAGDGDFGMSVAKGFKQLKREWDEIIKEESQSIGSFLLACSMVIMEYCGGASGPIWGSAFRAAGRNVMDKKELTIQEVADMLKAAVTGIQKTGERSFGRGAVVGDKTLMDALIPCANMWSTCASEGATIKEAFDKGAIEAVKGAKATKDIVARMGRAGTVGDRSLGYPDAGAHALGIIFTEIAKSIM